MCTIEEVHTYAHTNLYTLCARACAIKGLHTYGQKICIRQSSISFFNRDNPFLHIKLITHNFVTTTICIAIFISECSVVFMTSPPCLAISNIMVACTMCPAISRSVFSWWMISLTLQLYYSPVPKRNTFVLS